MNKQKTIIIAEAGVNHNGDIDLAKKMIEVAATSGADMVKFQTFSSKLLVTPNAQKAEYQNKSSNVFESQYDMLRRLELTREMHLLLIEHSKLHNIEFCSSGFDIDSINFLVDLGVDYIKIPSGEITNLPYLRHIGCMKKSVIISTGMAKLGEIEDALNVLHTAGTAFENLIVLHCNTEYPTPMSDVNLLAMDNIRRSFGVKVGYSDHTAGIEVAIAAVALGAAVIEKHFTLDRNLPGPDHKASLEPNELKDMVSAIRNIEIALGNGLKMTSKSEERNKSVVRKSIVASKFINAGDVFTIQNLTTKRPGNGISPMRWDEIIGCKAKRDFEEDEMIEL